MQSTDVEPAGKRSRYPALSRAPGALRRLAWLVGVLVVLAIGFAFYESGTRPPGGPPPSPIGTVMAMDIFAGLIGVLTLLVLADAAQALLDIEEHTRKTAERSQGDSE